MIRKLKTGFEKEKDPPAGGKLAAAHHHHEEKPHIDDHHHIEKPAATHHHGAENGGHEAAHDAGGNHGAPATDHHHDEAHPEEQSKIEAFAMKNMGKIQDSFLLKAFSKLDKERGEEHEAFHEQERKHHNVIDTCNSGRKESSCISGSDREKSPKKANNK